MAAAVLQRIRRLDAPTASQVVFFGVLEFRISKNPTWRLKVVSECECNLQSHSWGTAAALLVSNCYSYKFNKDGRGSFFPCKPLAFSNGFS